MLRHAVAAILAMLVATPTLAQVEPFPAGFTERDVVTNGTTIHVRIGGRGPAVVLLHGYGETGDMWAPLAANLARDHVVIVPDLRGLGLSPLPQKGMTRRRRAPTSQAFSTY